MATESLLKMIKKKLIERRDTQGLALLKATPNNRDLTLCIAHNKELCEVQPFFDLLRLFQYYNIEGHYLQQNINTTIISFRDTIYETYLTLDNIRRNLLVRDITQVHYVSRIGRNYNSSYSFFNSTTDKTMDTFGQPMLEMMVSWMFSILTHFDKHKTSQDEYDETFCLVIFRNLDIFYDFFYCLLCHIVNIRCDQNKRISIFLQEDL